MPIRGDKTKRDRDHRRSELDWFAEDPWSDPGLASLEDSQDDWDPDVWGTMDEDSDAWSESEEEGSDEDEHDGWGPVRRRAKRKGED